jgi:DNA processing protein
VSALGEQRVALAAWSAVAEPADVEAGALVRALGASAALEWVRAGCGDLSAAASALHGRCDKATAVGAAKAHERWARRLEFADQPLMERAARIGARVVIATDPEWPAAFRDLGDAAPFAVWVRGDGDLGALWRRSIAIVGSRSSTSYGEHMTAEIAGGVGDAGWTVVSGGAYGVDGVAHRAALVSDHPTVAIMAGGVDRLYPVGHEQLLGQVMESGCVLSEVPPGFAPHRSRFLSRNRLIATATATVVVEAAWRSGALSTANHAAELARPVGAVPGPATSPSSTGCHRLIREGQAVLVTSAADVVELAAPVGEALALFGVGGARQPVAAGEVAPPEFARPEHRAVYDALSSRAAAVDVVAKRAGLDAAATRGALAALDMADLAVHNDAGWRKKPAKLSAEKGI